MVGDGRKYHLFLSQQHDGCIGRHEEPVQEGTRLCFGQNESRLPNPLCAPTLFRSIILLP
jgi:hypothetical protein